MRKIYLTALEVVAPYILYALLMLIFAMYATGCGDNLVCNTPHQTLKLEITLKDSTKQFYEYGRIEYDAGRDLFVIDSNSCPLFINHILNFKATGHQLFTVQGGDSAYNTFIVDTINYTIDTEDLTIKGYHMNYVFKLSHLIKFHSHY